MHIYVSVFWIPCILSVVMLGIMLRPYRRSCDYDFGSIFRLFWLLPIAFTWALFFALLWVFNA